MSSGVRQTGQACMLMCSLCVGYGAGNDKKDKVLGT